MKIFSFILIVLLLISISYNLLLRTGINVNREQAMNRAMFYSKLSQIEKSGPKDINDIKSKWTESFPIVESDNNKIIVQFNSYQNVELMVIDGHIYSRFVQ